MVGSFGFVDEGEAVMEGGSGGSRVSGNGNW